MKEFIEKLIERLKQLPHAQEDMWVWLIDAEETIRELAEEHKGGWIPFEDPTCDSGNIPDGEVLVCREDGTMDFDVYDFMYDDWRFNSKCHKNKVIAWRNLPEPYKAEEPQPQWKQAMMNTFLKR